MNPTPTKDKMEATYQPIKRGMTEAVTRYELEAAEREGCEPVANVKQLTWFDTNEGACCVFGVLEGVVISWYENGRHSKFCENSNDLFALPRYEWQWLIAMNGKYFAVTNKWYTDAESASYGYVGPITAERIESSKRLVEAPPVTTQQADKVRELMLEACELRDKYSAMGYTDASYQISDEYIVDSILAKLK